VVDVLASWCQDGPINIRCTYDTDIIVKSPNSKDFQTNMVTAFNCVNEWVKVNLLSINVDKTHYIQFKTKNKPTLDINIVCNDNLITTLPKIKFLGIYIHDTINWRCHIEFIIPKPYSACSCYVMRSIRPFMPLNTLKIVYYSYFNAIISYSLPFGGNLPHAIKVFTMQKRIVTIMMGYKNRVSCRNLFRKLEILPFVYQYILLLMLFVVKNKNLFTLNLENHTKCTRQFNNFYQPMSNFTGHQKEVHYMGIRIFNCLPPYIKHISNNVRKFEIHLKQFLHILFTP